MSELAFFDPESLGQEEEHEVDRFLGALELEEGFAFHLIIADTRDVFEAAAARLPEGLQILRPRPPKNLQAKEEAAAWILDELDSAIDASQGSPVLLDAMIADREPAWGEVFRRLNELRNGLERRHSAPLIVAVSPSGESSLGREAPDLWSRRGSGMRLHDRRPIKRQTWRSSGPDREWLPPPVEPAAFESLCFDLFREIWNDPGAQRYGRSGQADAGVDVFGKHLGRQMGVQCKLRDGLRSRVMVRELEDEVEKALRFRPPLDSFILATTGPSDAGVQERARDMSKELAARGLLKVEVWSWTDIWYEIREREELLRRLLPVYWPRTSGSEGGQKLAPSKLRNVAEILFGRDGELERLDAAWADPGAHVVTLVAWGGVGKTSLVARWAAGVARRDFDGADYFNWSFYSQGIREAGGASAEAFVAAALEFFGDPAMAESAALPWDKGARLAQLVARRRVLLVLDGLEALQHPPGPLAGELSDPAVSALLKGLAARNPGLCLVTTRERVADLAPFRHTTAPEWELAQLAMTAGVGLLESLGVHGAEDELVRLVEEVGGHALTLNLLGGFLVRAFEGDVRRRDRVVLAKADLKIQGGHTFKILAAYEEWLAAGGEEGARQLAVLRLLGLFDRPADAGSLGALRREPPIAGLTEPLAGFTEDGWNLAVNDLAECGLVSPEGSALHAHPLIREYFARQLRERHLDAWRGGHGRLFDHLQASTEHRPDTLEGLQPLYQAVAHGCRAGRQREACDRVYFERILRREENYSAHKLGAVRSNLGAIACFFERSWSHVSPALPETARAWLLNQAGSHLRALVRLTEAGEPMRRALEWALEHEDWLHAATSSSNLSELEMTLGDVDGAVREAEQSVGFADRSGDAFQRLARRTTLADALHQAGRSAEALARFREAEAMQAEWQPAYPLLYSLPGVHYGDLLLAGAERTVWRVGCDLLTVAGGAKSRQDAGAPSGLATTCRDAERRAARTLEWSEQNRAPLLTIALEHLTLGRAGLYRVILEQPGVSGVSAESALDHPKSEIDQAVDGLRRAGQLDHLPRGLLTRALLRALARDRSGARRDLDEAWAIAERGPMPLFQADVHLHRARLFGDRDALAAARRLIDWHGYGRRREELADAEVMFAAAEPSGAPAAHPV